MFHSTFSSATHTLSPAMLHSAALADFVHFYPSVLLISAI